MTLCVVPRGSTPKSRSGQALPLPLFVDHYSLISLTLSPNSLTLFHALCLRPYKVSFPFSSSHKFVISSSSLTSPTANRAQLLLCWSFFTYFLKFLSFSYHPRAILPTSSPPSSLISPKYPCYGLCRNSVILSLTTFFDFLTLSFPHLSFCPYLH